VSRPVYLVWSEDYSVGNDELDGHHKNIISIINDLYSAIQTESTPEELNGILDRLFEYTMSHFEREEQLMEEHLFPDLAKHKTIHDRMRIKTDELRRRGLHHKKGVPAETMSFLKDWWLNHILVMDAQYRPHMKEKKD